MKYFLFIWLTTYGGYPEYDRIGPFTDQAQCAGFRVWWNQYYTRSRASWKYAETECQLAPTLEVEK